MPLFVALWGGWWWAGHQSAPFCSLFVPFPAACVYSKDNEDLKEQNSELQERLGVCMKEKEALRLGVEDLEKKLEMSELLLQQVRPRVPGSQGPIGLEPPPPARRWKVCTFVLLLP